MRDVRLQTSKKILATFINRQHSVANEGPCRETTGFDVRVRVRLQSARMTGKKIDA